MSESTIQLIISGVVGLITGAIASLIAPWVKWGIEKKKIQLDKKRQIIEEFRNILNDYGFDRKKLINNPNYRSIREFLHKESIKDLETTMPALRGVMGNDAMDHDKDRMYKALSELEQKWGIR